MQFYKITDKKREAAPLKATSRKNKIYGKF